MTGTGNWIVGALMGVVALIGLFMASRAVDTGFYIAGLLFFGFGILFNFVLIARHTGGHRGSSKGGD